LKIANIITIILSKVNLIYNYLWNILNNDFG